MFLGGFVGALLIRAGEGRWVLVAVLVLLLAVAAFTARYLRTQDEWTHS